MDRYGRDLELTAQRALVQRLDVLELVHVTNVAGVDFSFGQGVEHKGVVRVGTVRNVNGAHQRP